MPCQHGDGIPVNVMTGDDIPIDNGSNNAFFYPAWTHFDAGFIPCASINQALQHAGSALDHDAGHTTAVQVLKSSARFISIHFHIFHSTQSLISLAVIYDCRQSVMQQPQVVGNRQIPRQNDP